MKLIIKRLIVLFVLLLLGNNINAQKFSFEEPFANTFSIIAIDTITGEMAVGVQSHWFSVGTIVSWAKSGVGVVATQSFVNPALGTEGIKLMGNGKSANETLEFLINKDEGRDYRQVAMLDKHGNISVFTGKKCVQVANHIKGNNYSIQANMMLNDKVVPEMEKAFIENSDLALAERVLKAMKAGQQAGGDIRGKQSAVLLVVGTEPAEKEWEDKKIDIRIDDHSEPLIELERILNVHKAYEHMNNGDIAIEHGDMELALAEYQAAEQMFPNNLEMKYWKAIALANNGRLNEALPILERIFEQDKNWLTLTKRLPQSGLLNLKEEDLDKIFGLIRD